MIKQAGYLLFALFFHLFRLCPRKKNKVFLVATHDAGPDGNIGIVSQRLKEEKPEYEQVWFTRNNTIRRPVDFFVKKAYHLATASYVFLDNEFLPMAYLHFGKNVKVVQLWHGTGTIKRFGQDVNTGTLKKLEYRANQRITHLIVNSEAVKKEYASAFAVDPSRIYVIGNPRTDRMLDKQYLTKKVEQFYRDYPEMKEKRCILYAPTFRDTEVSAPKLHLDLQKTADSLGKEDVLFIRLHPHIATHLKETLEGWKEKGIYNVSEYPEIATLLAAAEVLITDYSSIVFEYCLLERPMLFYAYDLKEFEQTGRSFYRDYRSFVPGPVIETEEELLSCLKEQKYPQKESFVRENFPFLDGNATSRLFALIFSD